MPATILCDSAYGDSGKGKVVDYLTQHNYNHIVRFNGSANAGHTLFRDNVKYVCNQVPCGILNEGCNLYIGAGCVVDPIALEGEIKQLEARLGRKLSILISKKAHVVTPLDKAMDAEREKTAAIGTTKKGVGPAYAAKANRNGLRMGDLCDFDKVRANLDGQDGRHHFQQHDLDEIARHLCLSGEFLKHDIGDVEETIRQLLRDGNDVLFEGAQGTFLDVTHGDYPFCTSSHTVAAAAATYCGFPPQEIERVILVTKPYITRVGNGPLRHELEGDEAEPIRKLGNEYGAVTGRPRRIAWLDLQQLKLACDINGATDIAITKMDIAGMIGDLDVALDEEKFENFRKWAFNKRIEDYRSFDDFDVQAKKFCDLIQEITGVTVTLIGTGPNTNDVIDFFS